MNRAFQFFCVGAQKAGTSTLHDIIQQNPSINLPKRKETHFFRDDDKYAQGLDYYFKLFEKKKKCDNYGEIDPEYLYFEKCAQRILDTFQQVKIVLLLRDPIDRAYSHYLMTKSRGHETLSFEEAISSEGERLKTHFDHINYSYIARGKYNTQIERYEQLFGKQQVAVFLFDDFVATPEKVVTEIAKFVGLPSFDYDFSLKSNVAAEPKSERIRDFVYKPNRFKKWVGKLIPSKQMKNDIMAAIVARNKKKLNKIPLSTEVKRKIYKEHFEAEIETLEVRLGRSLEAWKL